MLYLLLSAIVFVLTVALHLLWCRYKGTEELHLTSFVVMGLVSLLAYFVMAPVVVNVNRLSPFWLLPLKNTAAVLYIFVLPFYLVFYYSTMIDSPSRRLIALIRAKGTLTYEELAGEITNERFIMTRLNPLVKYGYVHFDGKYYRLSPRAVGSCRIIVFYQKMLGRKIGG